MHKAAEVFDVVLAERHVLREFVEPPHLEHVGSRVHIAIDSGEELGEVSVANPLPVREVLLEDLRQERIQDLGSDLPRTSRSNPWRTVSPSSSFPPGVSHTSPHPLDGT